VARNFLGHQYNRISNLDMTAARAVCLVLWLLLTAKGEVAARTTGPKYSAQEEGRLLEQLRTYNEALTRVRYRRAA
jgi:hypothetical protein